MRTISTSTARQTMLTSWGKATVAALIANAVIVAVLVLHFLQVGQTVEPAIPVLGVLMLAVAAALVVTGKGWICIPAAAVLALILVGGLPHHLDALAGHSGTGGLVFAVIALGGEGVGIIVAVTTLVRGASTES